MVKSVGDEGSQIADTLASPSFLFFDHRGRRGLRGGPKFKNDIIADCRVLFPAKSCDVIWGKDEEAKGWYPS